MFLFVGLSKIIKQLNNVIHTFLDCQLSSIQRTRCIYSMRRRKAKMFYVLSIRSLWISIETHNLFTLCKLCNNAYWIEITFNRSVSKIEHMSTNLHVFHHNRVNSQRGMYTRITKKSHKFGMIYLLYTLLTNTNYNLTFFIRILQ